MRRAGILTLTLGTSMAIAGCGTTDPRTTNGHRSTAASTTAPEPSSTARTASPALSGHGIPRPDHIVLVMLENKSYDEVVGRPEAPFLNSLEQAGAVFTQSYAITHPSQPNYLALFSGSTQGVTDDSCPRTFGTPNLGQSLLDAGKTFTGYSEDLPAVGYTGCTAGQYGRKHAPWVNFSNLPATVNQPMSAFPTDPAALPTVSFVIPNLDHDLHDGTLTQADQWLRDHLARYAGWAPTHNSVLIITNDEDDFTQVNRIATMIVGASVIPGQYAKHIDHFSLLRTIEDAYGLPRLGASAQARPITEIWSG